MKNFFPAILLFLGSVGYQSPHYVSLTLYPNRGIVGVRLIDLDGDSIKVERDTWINLQQVRFATYHAPGTGVSVSTKSGERYILSEYSFLEDGSLEGEGHVDDYRETHFSGMIQKQNIIGIQNHTTVSYFLPSLLGGLAGCTTGLFVAGEPRVRNLLWGGGPRACADVKRSLLGCTTGLAIGGFLGYGIANVSSSAPYTYDFSRASIEERRVTFRSILNE